jgi:hypothetical protein
MTMRLLSMLTGIALVASAVGAAEVPFRDAVAVWHFDQGAHSAFPLTVHGSVTLGVPLDGPERAASLARGGDGAVARFDGGYLEVGGPAFDPPGAEFTLAVRMRDPEGAWNAPLFGSYGGDDKVSLYLRGVDGAKLPRTDHNYVGGPMSTPAAWMFGWPGGPRAITGARGVIEFLWGANGLNLTPGRVGMLPGRGAASDTSPLATDARNAVLRLMVPVEPLGPGAWHDVVVRGTGAKLELWVDGVLLDEEFPIGRTRPSSAPRYFAAARDAQGTLLSGFHGQMDHAALWHRALRETEIAALSGGIDIICQREPEVLGPLPEKMQYFRPRGHNSKAGDCFPYFHDGTFHLFYLILRRNMHSKWDGGHGGLEIFHASTRDLTHWTHHPRVVPVTEQWEAWNGTGGTVHHDGKFWMFYPCPDYDSDHAGIQLTVSSDGEHFVKQQPHPFLPGGDCEVFADPDPGITRFHLLRQGKTIGNTLPELRDKTLVAWASPADLDQAGAGVVTLEGPGGRFDSIVLGEAAHGRWMAGSDNFQRTQAPHDQMANAEETAAPGVWVQLAAVYSGRSVTLYRNGTRYARYDVASPIHFGPGARVLLGLRHLDRQGDPKAHFRGAIADARVYDRALTEAEVASLRPHEPGGPRPLVWFDFRNGGTADRTGAFRQAELEGRAEIRDGKLVLGSGGDCLMTPGRQMALAHLVSDDLKSWRELPEPFLVTDESVVPQMCPHWFRWNDWYYFIGGIDGIFRSRQAFGPWTRQRPGHLDNLSVPKTGAFTGDRRIFAGFLGDGGWGGNLVLRELVQHADGTLGTRFVPEMIPASGPSVARSPERGETRLEAREGRRQILLDAVPNDVRVTLTLAPAGARAYGLRLRTTDGNDGTELRLSPEHARASYSHSTHSGSGGPLADGPALTGVTGLDQPVRLDVVCRHDIVDVEIDGRHTLVNRFWNPKGDHLGVWVEGGTLVVRNVRIRPLLEHVPPGGLRAPEADTPATRVSGAK